MYLHKAIANDHCLNYYSTHEHVIAMHHFQDILNRRIKILPPQIIGIITISMTVIISSAQDLSHAEHNLILSLSSGHYHDDQSASGTLTKEVFHGYCLIILYIR